MEGLFDITDADLVSADKLLFVSKGEKKRICIRDSQVAAVDVHVVLKDKRGKLELCPRSESRGCKYCDQGFVPSKRFCLRVFEYISREGKTTVRLLPWVFGQDKLDGLRKGLPRNTVLKSTEWLLTCTNPTFQSFSIQFLQDCWLRKDEQLKSLAVTLSKRVKADGLSVLKALVAPAIPAEKSQSRGYSQSQYQREREPQPSQQSLSPPQPPSSLNQTALDDLAEFGGAVESAPAAEPLTSATPEVPVEPSVPESVVPESSQVETEKGENLADWEKDLDAVLGDM